MRTLAVVVVGPDRNFGPGVIEAEEQGFVEKLIPHPAVEALAEAVLHRLSGRDEVPVDLVLLRPGQHGVAGELGAVVGDDHAWLAALIDQRRQFARHPPSRDRGVGDRRQAFSRHVIDDVQDPEAATTGELVMDKIQRPAGIRPGLDQDRRPGAHGAAAGPALAHGKAFLTVQPIDPVQPGRLAQLPQQHEQPAVTEPPASIGKLAQLAAQFCVRRPARLVADHLAVSADDAAGPPLRQTHDGLQVRDSFALGDGPYHFFDRSSRNAAASSICSASSFFSLAFSSSSCRSRLASETSIPPNLAFQL